MIWLLVAHFAGLFRFSLPESKRGCLRRSGAAAASRQERRSRGACRLQENAQGAAADCSSPRPARATDAADIMRVDHSDARARPALGWLGYPRSPSPSRCRFTTFSSSGVLPKSLFRRFPLRAVVRLSGLLEPATKLLTAAAHAIGAVHRAFHFRTRPKSASRLLRRSGRAKDDC